MERKWFWRVVLTIALVVLAAGAAVSTVVPKPADGQAGDPIPAQLREWFGGINLGLDLQGGLRLQYEVEVEAAVEDKRNNIAESMVQNLAEKAEIKDVEISYDKEDYTRFALVFPSAADRDSKDTKEVLMDYRQTAVVDREEDDKIYVSLVETIIKDTREIAVKQAIETIGNRIDELGLANTSVTSADVDIFVEIPGIDDSRIARIKRIISTTARLEFKIVDESGTADFFAKGPVAEKLRKEKEAGGPVELRSDRQRAGDEGDVQSYFLVAKNEPEGRSGRQIIKEFLAEFDVPSNRTIAYKEDVTLDEAGNPTPDITWRTFYLHRTAGITGEYVENAMVLNDDQSGQPYVSLDFSTQGAELFGTLTEENVKRRMAIQLDDKVNSAPIINEKIGGGRARITLGGFDSYQNLFAQAQDLVVVLRAGALPAPVKPVTESTIGPQLGQDAIDMGSYAFMISGIVILLFMLVYYRGGGFAADLALLCNALFIMGILSGMEATLTLPGIAGIVLTIGMAVDANVIIYERIREELRAGKSPRAAVDAGYKRAFWTIFDAQITTFIAGVVMLQYGTGAIKGFAVTLLIGIVTSMFSSIFISRLVFDFMTRRRADHLSI